MEGEIHRLLDLDLLTVLSWAQLPSHPLAARVIATPLLASRWVVAVLSSSPVATAIPIEPSTPLARLD
jgi:hypothetical protein